MKATLGLVLVLTMGSAALVSAPAAEAAARVVVRTPRLTVVAPVAAPRVRHGHGELHVNVDPERAKVWIDGRYIGRGDATRVLRAGRHTVRVQLGDGRDASQTVVVDAGQLTRVRLDLD